MNERPMRRQLIQRLLEAACRSAVWNTTSTLPLADRLSDALSANQLEVTAAGTTLTAWINDDVQLLIRVRITRGWTSDVEEALYATLRQQGSLVASLLLAEWTELCSACESAYRGAGRTPRNALDER